MGADTVLLPRLSRSEGHDHTRLQHLLHHPLYTVHVLTQLFPLGQWNSVERDDLICLAYSCYPDTVRHQTSPHRVSRRIPV